MVRLNLGAGESPVPGFDNLDRITGQEVFPLAYADNSVDEIRASHVLEHFGHGRVLEVLADWFRVLKPGGLMRIAVPNLEWIATNYLAGKDFNFQGYLMGGQGKPDDQHGAVFDKQLLTDAMRHVGLVDIDLWQSEILDCAALPVSLNLKGTKPAPLPKLKIGCAMSVPRLGFQDNFFCWVNALLPLGLNPVKYNGAFWGQCLERVMSDMIEMDFILTVDYDSVFTIDHVRNLIRLAVAHPEADAIAPVQNGRDGMMPLVTIKDEKGNFINTIERKTFDPPLLRVHSAHFGLTIIRTAALKTMPHPWFVSVPDSKGEWGEGRLDDDVHFWKKWREVGNSLYLSPRSVIGHGEFVITWPDNNFEPLYQRPSEFWATGMPERVWR